MISHLGRLLERLDPLATGPCDRDQLRWLRQALAEVSIARGPEQTQLLLRAGRRVGVVRAYGSVTLYGPDGRRCLDLDPGGRVTAALRWEATGTLQEAWVWLPDGTALVVARGDDRHPLWGPSDRLLRVKRPAAPVSLTLIGRVDWARPGAIPPLAEPARLPAGGGAAVLNLLAGLAADAGVGHLRYRGPYPTEQLFWTLLESFRFAPGTAGPLVTFTADAERCFATGVSVEPPVDWIPTPHEQVTAGDVVVQLRDGVEKVVWEGRTYYRDEWQGLRRREHRVVRPVGGPGGARRFLVGLAALGEVVEVHLALADDGRVQGRAEDLGRGLREPGGTPDSPAARAATPGTTPEVAAPVPLAPIWRDALGWLLLLEATPWLAPAIRAVWPALDVRWGPVWRDLVAVDGETIRLSGALAARYRSRLAGTAAAGRRELARALVRDVLGLLGPPVRAHAGVWLESLPAPGRDALLEAGGALDRARLAARAAVALRPLLDALERGGALP